MVFQPAKPPTNSEEVRSFLRLCSYVSTFIKEFATITEPLWQRSYLPLAQKETEKTAYVQ